MVQKEYNVLIHRLKKRFNSCYDEYMRNILKQDKNQIIEAASEIMAVKETYMEICFWLEISMCKHARTGCMDKQSHNSNNNLIKEPMHEQDAINLLALENPLKELALKWWFYSLGKKADFHDFYRVEREIVKPP